MYRIVCSDGTVLYDQVDVNGDRVVTEPTCSIEISQNGSTLQFSMLPSHPAYDDIFAMKTYLSAEREGEEIFYGRVTEIRVEKTTGVKQVSCTGAMSFLDDFELTPLKGSEQEMSAADFFRYCIDGYGTELGDEPKRALSVGIIDHPKSSMRRKFGLTSYQKVKQSIDTFIIKEFGGYIRIRESEDSSNQVNAERIQRKYFQLGNVDLFDRPQVTGQTMIQAGWDADPSETATVYSVSYSAGTEGINWSENVILHLTPIRQDGTVLSPSQIDSYATSLFASSANITEIKARDSERDGLVLWIQNGVTNWTAAHARADLYDELLHRLQAVYYLDEDDFPTESELKQFDSNITVYENIKGHVVDWIEEFGASNESPIELANNVITHENAITSNDFFTVIHPLGKDGASLPEITINVDDDLVNEYGRIIKTVSFSNATSIEDLRSEVTEYKTKMAKGLGKTCTVKLIDIHFLDDSVDRLQLGAVYENIAGFENEGMTVFSMELHFDNPAEDTVTLKNHRELTAVKNGSSTGKISKMLSSTFANIYKHITETKEMLSIHADVIELHGVSIRETANEFERYSRDTDSTIGGILGTGVLQNSDHITQVAGNFTSKYSGVTTSRLNQLIAKGISPKSAGLYEIEAITVREDMIGSGIELFGSPTAALNGVSLDTSTLTVGETVYRAVLSNDTEVDPQGHYYSKALMVGTGTEVIISEDGQEVNVYESIDSVQENLLTITGSALWTQRDGITGVAGQFEIQTDPETQQRTLVIVSGGGMKIRRNNVEYGIYDEDRLTGGIIVEKVNGQGGSGTLTRIRGEYVDIEASQVRIGSTSNVQSWMNSTGQDISDLQGLVADKATIAQLNVQKARIDTIETDYINATELETFMSHITAAGIGTLTADYINLRGSLNGGTILCSNLTVDGNSFSNPLVSASVGGTNNDTLTLTYASGASVTFRKAASITAHLVGSWSGNTYQVIADNDPNVLPVSTTVSFSPTSNTINSFSNHIAYATVSAPGVTGPLKMWTIDASSEYSAGESAGASSVTLSVGGWQNGSNRVSASNGKYADVTLPSFTTSGGTSFTNHKTTVYFSTASVTGSLASKEVDATSEYNSGYNAGANSVTLTVGGWQNGTNRVTASNGQYKDVTLPSFSTSGGTSFTNHKTTVYFATASVTGNLASKEVDATSEYNSGWTGSYNAVTLSATGTKSLTYGESVTIYPKAKSSSGATAANITSISYKVTAPADRYQTGYNAGYTQGNLDGIDSVTISTVEQQGAITYSGGNYSVPVKATASNSKTGSGTITFAATAAYNAGWNGVLSELGISSGGTVTIGGTYYANLYVMNQSGPSRVGYGMVNYSSRKTISPK